MITTTHGNCSAVIIISNIFDILLQKMHFISNDCILVKIINVFSWLRVTIHGRFYCNGTFGNEVLIAKTNDVFTISYTRHTYIYTNTHSYIHIYAIHTYIL